MEKENLVREMLMAIGENPEREGLKDTPKRVVKMWKEIYRGYNKEVKPLITVFDNGVDEITYDQMITDERPFYSQCEHHMVSFSGKFFFAYIPHPKGKILGLSKVARIVDYFSARLQVQERLTQQIVNELWNALCKNSEHPPIGMGLMMKGKHLCKSMRGVKKDGYMTTTELRGALREEEAARAEFSALANLTLTR